MANNIKSMDQLEEEAKRAELELSISERKTRIQELKAASLEAQIRTHNALEELKKLRGK